MQKTQEKTLSIIKPDAMERGLSDEINAMIGKAGLRIVARKQITLTREQAERFYQIHCERPFFKELVDRMTSGPIIVQVLAGENAVARYRDLMGATNPALAASGTIRRAFALSTGDNSVHGSDSLSNAVREVDFFFDRSETGE